MGDIVLGFEGVLLRNSAALPAGYASPTWVAMTNVKNCKLSLSSDEGDATARNSNGWGADEPTLLRAQIEFDVNWDPSDTNFQALKNAYLNRSKIDVKCLNGPVATDGSEGLRAVMKVFSFERDEPIDGIMVASVVLKPCYDTNAPTWVAEESP